jgi:predicted Zn-dependent protease
VYVIGVKPEYLAARMALAGLYLKANQADQAIVQLRAAAKQDAQNASVWEQIGDAEKALNHADAAREAYATALKLQIEKGDRKRIRAKMTF